MGFPSGIEFQSLTRDSNHSNIILDVETTGLDPFQSLTRDSNHSNAVRAIQAAPKKGFQSLTRDSNHSNCRGCAGGRARRGVSIPHAG